LSNANVRGRFPRMKAHIVKLRKRAPPARDSFIDSTAGWEPQKAVSFNESLGL